MKGKITALAIVVLLCSVFGLFGCDKNRLDDYKTKGKETIDGYLAEMVQGDYKDEEWAVILQIAQEGKQSIDLASDKTEIDKKIEWTKNTMDLGYYEIEKNDLVEFNTWYFTSGVPNNEIIVNWSEGAVIECVTDKGHFGFVSKDEKRTIVKSGEAFYWNSDTYEENGFITIKIRIGDIIVGYAVIKTELANNGAEYTACVLKSAVFPKIGDYYQQISDTRVDSIISRILEK